MPISRILERTVASMIFIMPTPLTSRVTRENRSSITLNAVAVFPAMERTSERSPTSYTDSERCLALMAFIIAWVAQGTLPESVMEK